MTQMWGGIAIKSVYLLDDDKIIINSVKEAVPWQKIGFDIIGSNTDFDQAVREIMALRPMLVIYEWQIGDITLIKKLRAAGLDCEFVTISYSWSPETMRKFFHSGGFDFLLLPINSQGMEAVLEKLNDKFSQYEQRAGECL